MVKTSPQAQAWQFNTEPGWDLRERELLFAPLGVRVAQTLEEVVASWQLVYDVYRTTGLIAANPYAVHTAPHMVQPGAVVIQRLRGRRLESTLSAVVDGKKGLPLDSVYGLELDTLRCEGRRLVEVGQFAHAWHGHAADEDDKSADTRGEARLALAALTELTGFAFAYGLSRGATDFVIGVHPRHCRFYQRAWGFMAYGSLRVYPNVNNRPVVLLRGDWRAVLRLNPVPYALQHLLHHPIDTAIFADRFDFNPFDLAASDIYDYLRWKESRRYLVA